MINIGNPKKLDMPLEKLVSISLAINKNTIANKSKTKDERIPTDKFIRQFEDDDKIIKIPEININNNNLKGALMVRSFKTYIKVLDKILPIVYVLFLSYKKPPIVYIYSTTEGPFYSMSVFVGSVQAPDGSFFWFNITFYYVERFHCNDYAIDLFFRQYTFPHFSRKSVGKL